MKSVLKRVGKGFKRRYIVRALIAGQGRVMVAAKLSGLNRTHFHTAMRTLGIDLEKLPLRDVRRVKPYREEHREFFRRFYTRLLTRAEWSPSKAERLSGINRTHFYRATEKFGVKWPRVLKSTKGNAAWRALDARPHAATRANEVAQRPAVTR